MVVGLVGLIGQRIAGTNAANAFFYPGTIGVLALLVAYIVTNLGAISHLFIRAARRPLWQLVIPVLAIAFLVFTIYKNVHGALAPYSHFPWYVLAWLAVGGARGRARAGRGEADRDRAHERARARRRRRLDVGVEAEEVVRVVGALERREPGVLLLPVGGAHAILPLVAEEVHVRAPGRRRSERVVALARPPRCGRSASGSSGSQTVLMFTLCAASRWL